MLNGVLWVLRRREPPGETCPSATRPTRPVTAASKVGCATLRWAWLISRELEVLPLMAQGKSNSEIAKKLSISRATAKVHVRHIINKLGVSDRTQAVVRAIELGLVDPEVRR